LKPEKTPPPIHYSWFSVEETKKFGDVYLKGKRLSEA